MPISVPDLLSFSLFNKFLVAFLGFLAHPFKVLIDNIIRSRYLKKEEARKRDAKLFLQLEEIFPEPIFRSALYSIKVNAEFPIEYVSMSDQYQLYVEGGENGKFLNKKVEAAHSNFILALKNMEKDLFEDFRYYGDNVYRPIGACDMTEKGVKAKYSKIVADVLKHYSKYRNLVKKYYKA